MVFHSHSYKRKGSSDSYTISYNSDGCVNFGQVITFCAREDQLLAIVQVLERTYDFVFKPFNNVDGVAKFIRNEQLGREIIPLSLTLEVTIVNCELITEKLIFVSDDGISGYGSIVLSSYQHD